MQTVIYLLIGALVPALPAYSSLSLEQAVSTAQENDPWLQGSHFRQQAIEAQSVSAGRLPDPMVNVGFANLPTDTFDFDQEAMTQFKVGVSQVFPRGDSLSLRQQLKRLEAGREPYERQVRRAQIAVEVSSLWLEAFRAFESIRLIEQDKNLFEQLVDVAQSGYATARGSARQQDLIRAQLELTRLEDRLTRLDERYAMAGSRLLEWLQHSQSANPIELSSTLPQLQLRHPGLAVGGSNERIATHLMKHPAILSLRQRVQASETGIELAEQSYRPRWQLNASYGYRDDDPMGRDRADFFSVGLSFDLPLFTSKRQDQEVQSAIANSEATRTDLTLKLRNMVSGYQTQRSRLERLEARKHLYGSRLLQELQEQADASLSAYTNDEGDFAEVVRAHIDVLNARIEALDIEVERLKTISRLNYFLTETEAETREAAL